MKKKSVPKIVNVHLVVHIAFEKFHLLKQEGTLVWPGNPNNGKNLIIEVNTPKNKHGDFGRAKTIYYLDGKDTPTFPTFRKLFNHLNKQKP